MLGSKCGVRAPCSGARQLRVCRMGEGEGGEGRERKNPWQRAGQQHSEAKYFPWKEGHLLGLLGSLSPNEEENFSQRFLSSPSLGLITVNERFLEQAVGAQPLSSSGEIQPGDKWHGGSVMEQHLIALFEFGPALSPVKMLHRT